MPFAERDVSVDQAAAQEMVRRSGQMGVPVIIADDEVIVGFDRPRLERIASRLAEAGSASSGSPSLGLRVRDTPQGVAVGGTRPGSPADRAGFQRGDILERLGGQPVPSVATLERLSSLFHNQPVEAIVRRGSTQIRLVLR